MEVTGAEAIILSLLEEQVEVLFGYPGGAIMPTYDALYDASEKLQHVLVRHEQGAVHAAEGYSRATGKTGVCIATSGPGATNLITGITDAMLDSIPLVCITGQVPSHLLGTDAFQEADILGMTVPVTKWNYQITSAEEIPAAFAKAFYLAHQGRPGPVLLDITKDAQNGKFDFNYQRHQPKKTITQPPPLDLEKIKQAAELINQAKKPYCLIGHGVLISGAEQELINFAEKSGVPVASTLLGLSAFPTDHPLYAGMLGMHGNYGCNVLTNEADVIIAIGMRFDDRVTGKLEKYARQAKIIHIEIDQAEINKNVRCTIGLEADAKLALQALAQHLEDNQHTEWVNEFKQHKQLEYDTVIAAETAPASGQIKMAEVIHQLSEKTQGEAIIVTDVGQHQMVTARYYHFKNTNSHITSGGLGTMGFSLPAAVGAKFGAPDRQVISISGDGGFQMNIQELGVVAQENLPLKIIILNNSYLGMVRQWQELFFEERYSFTHLKNPDFTKIAEGYGIQAKKVSERADLDHALTEFLASENAYLLEIVVEEQHNVFPMVPSGASVCEMRLE